MNKKSLGLLVVVGVLITVVLQFMFKSPAPSAEKKPVAEPVAPAAASPDTQAVSPSSTTSATAAEPSTTEYTINIPAGSNNEVLLQVYNDMISKDSNDGNALYQRGLIYARMKNYQRAIDDFSEALRLRPTSANCYVNRAESYLKTKDLNRAMRDYDAAININANDPRLFISRGLAYVEKNDLIAALADFNKAVTLNASYDKAYFGRGAVYEKQQRYVEAKADYDKAIQYNKVEDEDVDDKDATARLLNYYYRRGIVNLDLNDFPAAMADVNYVLQATQSEAKAYRLRAAINTQMGNVSDAAADTALANKLEAVQAK